MSKMPIENKAAMIAAAFVVVCIVMFQLYQVYEAYQESSTTTVEQVEKVRRETYAIDWVASGLIYAKDDRTGLCFAGPPVKNSNLSFTMVPCTEAVLQAIKDRGEK